jgi:hypothetical protein
MGLTYSASQCRWAEVSFIEKSKRLAILRAKGFEIDQLQTCGNTISSSCSYEDLLRYFVESHGIVISGRGSAVQAFEAFSETMFRSNPEHMGYLGDLIDTYDDRRVSNASLQAPVETWKDAMGKDTAFEILKKAAVSSMHSYMAGRRVFSSSSGRSGMAPAEAEIGDKICILLGCSFPVILRPADDGKSYTLIGEAYVHEYMDGKAMGELYQGKYSEKDFDLI